MISRIEVFLRRLRRIFSRSEWTIHLLRLSTLKQPTTEPGLVMVQIDGLSMTQFNRGLQQRNLPFLQGLLSKERYVQRSFYSGLPSNTPAVQAELFYGVKGCVPAFHFFDRQLGRTAKMNDSAYVEEFEKRLKSKGAGLLAGGSSYSNIYTGSSKESHCCWSKMGWDGLWWAVNPLVFPFLVILYIDIFVRTLVLVLIELFLAIIECMRGTLKGRLFFRELEMVLLRSLVCVLLREFITAGVCIDIMRGLPVIHLNFLGYDEQAHGRGPSSSFAHWSLRGIDDSIKRIHNVIKESPLRHYDLWVYSDHGQSKTIPYFVKYGRTIEEAVQELFGNAVQAEDSLKTRHEATKSRVSLLRNKKNTSSLSEPASSTDIVQPAVIVTAMGPLGHIYVNKDLNIEDLHFYAKKLVSLLKIPLVLTKEGPKILAWTPRGCFIFPDEIQKIFGAQHPFLEELKEDLLRVCLHPDAGEFVIAGWCDGVEAISFPLEYGAHASMGPEETHGFVLLPMDAPVDIADNKNYMRPMDLRHTAQHFLNKETLGPLVLSNHGADSKTLTLMSYNVHGCTGMDGNMATQRIARVIARYNPDIIALQELDVGRLRSGKIDQAEMIARKLEMKYHFHPAFRWKDEQYGNAILSRYPMALIKSGALPKLEAKGQRHESRGVLWVSVEFEGKKIQVLNTHLSLSPRERDLQVDALLSQEWLQHPDCRGPVILCGDFNSLPRSSVYRKICHKLYDSQAVLAGHRPRSTWFGHYPVSRIDYVFINSNFHVQSITVPRTELEKVASDHLPLITELDFVKL
jgi:endonuclease/exonuclease/phosphatase family metal-dependent hydrolase